MRKKKKSDAAHSLRRKLIFILAPAGTAVFAIAFTIPVVAFFAADYLGLRLTWLGLVNLAAVTLALIWFACDWLIDRHLFWQLFQRIDPPLRPSFRLARKFFLFISAFLTICSAVIALQPDAADASLSTNALNTLAALSGAFVAALGWMITSYEKEKADRDANTLQALRDAKFTDVVAVNHEQMTALVRYVRGIKRKQDPAFNRDRMVLKPEDLATPISVIGVSSAGAETLATTADKFFDVLDQFALGARLGNYDWKTLQKVLRPRYVRMGYVFADYLKSETKARLDARYGQYVAQKRTWEHFLWLSFWFEKQPGEIDETKLILPPCYPGLSRSDCKRRR